jgi:quinol monooxygenase YgiN
MFPLTSVWTISEGNEDAAISALKALAKQVEQQQPGTLAYLVHVPDMSQPSLPTPTPLQVVFFEIYKDEAAFIEHVTGSLFNDFVNSNKKLFLCLQVTGTDGKKIEWPYTTVEFLTRQAGFVRPEVVTQET